MNKTISLNEMQVFYSEAENIFKARSMSYYKLERLHIEHRNPALAEQMKEQAIRYARMGQYAHETFLAVTELEQLATKFQIRSGGTDGP